MNSSQGLQASQSAMSSLLDLPPGTIFELIQASYTSNINQVATATLLYWDIILNMDQEIKLIWGKPLNLVSILYGLMRYLPLVSQTVDLVLGVGVFNTTHNICGGVFWFGELAITITIAIVDIFFIFRIFAFYGRRKSVLIITGVAYIIATVINLVFVILTGTEYQALPIPILEELLPHIIGECLTLSIPKIEFALLVTELVFQTLLFVLVMGRFIYLQITAWKGGRNTNQLYIVFFRDGLWAYLFFFVFFLASAILIRKQDPQVLDLTYFIGSFLGIIPPRILLNLKQMGTMDLSRSGDYTYASTHMSFTNRPPKGAVQSDHLSRVVGHEPAVDADIEE